MLTSTDDSTFTITNALYVPGIKKNLLAIFAPAKIGLLVKFMDDRCRVHDIFYGDSIIASGFYVEGFTSLIAMKICVEDVACTVVDLQAIFDAKLWHAHFGLLNFASLLRLQKFEVSLHPDAT